MIWFSWAFQQYCFPFLSPSTSSTNSTHRPMIHQSTYPNPSPHTHKNTNHQTINKATHTNTNHQQSHTHTNHQTSWSQQRPPHPPSKPLISKPKLPIKNPRCRFETQPIWNPSEQTHSKKIITGATIRATDDQPNRPTHQSTDPPFQTHHQLIPAHRSKPSLLIHDE